MPGLIIGGRLDPGEGRKVTFHGAFKSKADAMAKEREVGEGAYIEERRIKGQGRRFVVLTRKDR